MKIVFGYDHMVYSADRLRKLLSERVKKNCDIMISFHLYFNLNGIITELLYKASNR